MSWSDAVPNLVIGLREGLEAGLVVSILLAAVRKSAAVRERTVAESRLSTAPIWLGVLGAVSVAASFAAVLTYSTSALSSSAQEAVGGLLSVLAVGLVTGMVFWMRRTAAGLSSHLRGEVARAAAIGAGALTLTAFLAVGREGLETTLFLWTAVRASGQTAAPLLGAAIGLAAAVTLCRLLYQRAIRLDLGAFFGRTAIALIVIAAGILAYGLGDLQDAGLLPGASWMAFDLTGRFDPSSWWVTLVSGTTELSPKMTVLQVTAWAAYLLAVLPAFVRAGTSRPAPAPAEPAAGDKRASRWEQLAGRRPWPVGGILVLVPVSAAAVTVALLPSAAAATTSVTMTASACAPQWSTGHTGTQTFSVDNTSGRAGEVDLDNSGGAVVAEIETIGPSTTATMTATLGPGTYHFVCLLSGRPTLTAAPVELSGSRLGPATAAVAPVTVADLTGPNRAYQRWAADHLRLLSGEAGKLGRDVASGRRAAARGDWLRAQETWEEVGASYDSFGPLGLAVDGLPSGLPGGVHDPHFVGLHRIEYGLWHDQPLRPLRPVVAGLQRSLAGLRRHLTSDAVAGDPTNLPIRAHEILEDALRDHLSGIDDEGAGAAYPETYADTEVTRVVLGELARLIQSRAPTLLATADRQLTRLQRALIATRSGGRWSGGPWREPSITPLKARQNVDAAIGTLLQTLSTVPDILDVPLAP